MVARNEGRILFTSSIAAEAPAPYEAVYGASKAFVQSFAQGLRDELRNTTITITALQPGATETNFFHRAGGEPLRPRRRPKRRLRTQQIGCPASI